MVSLPTVDRGEARYAPFRFDYLPPLDGIRAIAVLAVMAYHGGIPWAPGGFFGVDAFFVLSGFLITSLIASEWTRTATIALRDFWARRARRLLPALFLMVLGVALFAGFVAAPGTYPTLRLDTVSTILYVANWHFILSGQNYFNQTAAPSPLLHTWSLAIEEQFYLVWPVVVLAVLYLTRSLKVLFVLAATGALASAVEMGILYSPTEITRLYYGTDTRAQDLLIGACLAVGMLIWNERKSRVSWIPIAGELDASHLVKAHQVTSRWAKWLWTLIGLGGAGFFAWALSQLNGDNAFVYRGGFGLVSLSVAAVIASIALWHAGPIARVLGTKVLRYLGKISYGMYLWHWPLFIALDASRTGLINWELFALRAAATLVVATASFYLVEQPIRQRRFLKTWKAVLATPVSAVAAFLAVVLATASMAPSISPSQFLNHLKATTVSSVPKQPPVKVLLVGDSVAVTLGWGLSVAAPSYGIDLYDKGILGCGVAMGQPVRMHGRIEGVVSACETVPGVVGWPTKWRRWIEEFHPNVVVLLAGRWEVLDRVHDGKWMHLGEPAYDHYVEAQLELAYSIMTSEGARAVFLTAPCYDSGEQPNGQPWPEDSPARLSEYNKLLREVAAQHRNNATVINLDGLVCPGGKFKFDFHGYPLRTPDGVHFTTTTNPPGGELLAPYLLPEIASIGREQMKQAR